MSEIKRIDPAAVAAWFKVHRGTEPIQLSYFKLEFDGLIFALSGCCGLSSQFLANGHRPDSTGVPDFSAALNLDSSYTEGFMNGWDGFSREGGLQRNDLEFTLGHADGVASYAATMEAIR